MFKSIVSLTFLAVPLLSPQSVTDLFLIAYTHVLSFFLREWRREG